MINGQRSGILDGKEEISKFLGGMSDYKLEKFVKAGMPVRIEEGRWLAHVDNVEEFFRLYTRVDSRQAVIEVIQNEPTATRKKPLSRKITPKLGVNKG